MVLKAGFFFILLISFREVGFLHDFVHFITYVDHLYNVNAFMKILGRIPAGLKYRNAG